MELKYQDGTTAQYNGNIANQVYANGGSSNTFTYGYDFANRLTSGSATGMSESMTYNTMGNIKSMSRDGGTTGIYNYTGYGNQLHNITSGPLATGDYVYDPNGNATTDGRTGKSLSYNMLNLPATVSGSPSVTYTYDANGRKLRKVLSSGGYRDYIDGIEYNSSTLDIIHTEEGIARNNSGTYSYEYNLEDQLGNVRTTFYNDPGTGSADELQRDDYYPFGMRKTVLAGSNDNKYLYNSKELQDELGDYDYGARFYDPVVGRWNVVDPLSEIYDDFSPYNYTFNNPIRFVDPDGMGVADSVKKQDPKPIELKEVVVTAKANPAKNILKAGMTAALIATQVDSPLPGPGDAAGLTIAAGTLISAGVAWLGHEIYQTYQSHMANSEKTIDDVKGDAKHEGKTGNGTDVYNKPGGLQQAEKDFDDIVVPGSARPIANGKVGKTADGKTVNVRNRSSDGRPTLEIYNPNTRQSETKIRYK